MKQTPIVSLATTQSTLLQHEVYLTDRIDNPSRSIPSTSSTSTTTRAAAYPPTLTKGGTERLPHLKCVVLLRPTEESILACERELKEGRYGGYWLCESCSIRDDGGSQVANEKRKRGIWFVIDFTNVLTKMQIERLAEADQHELVNEVQVSCYPYSLVVVVVVESS